MSASGAPAPPARIAYLVGRYPDVSKTFVLREVRALRELGVEVDTFAIWRSRPEQLLAAEDRDEAARTHAFLPPRAGEVLRSQLAAIAASPRAYAELVVAALRVAPPGLRGRGIGLTWILEAPMLWRCLRRRGIDHVHAHLPGTAPAVAMLATRLANRVRRDGGRSTWSLTVHGPAEFYEVARQSLPVKLRDADLAVAISDFGRSQLMAFVEEEHWDKFHVVHCGVDPRAYEPRHDGARAGDAPVELVTVGRLAPVKGHALLLQALRDLRARGVETRLTIVGDGPERAALARLAGRLGLDDAVALVGAVGQHEIARHYRDADLYVHASFAEGIPVVLMEAMAHRLPVVATGVMGVGELVRDGETGLLVRPGRTDELADAIERLSRDPDARRAMGDAGRQVVEGEFDAYANAARLRELFARVNPATRSRASVAESDRCSSTV